MTTATTEPNIILGSSFPPFLEKLQLLVKSCDQTYGYWSHNGRHFIVCSEEFEEKVLKKYFKGTMKTFIRQLHFYCFKKSEAVGNKWSFSHPNFQRDRPELMSLIKRKTKLNSNTFASKEELDSLRTVVNDLKVKAETELHSIRTQLGSIFRVLNEVQANTKRETRNSIASESNSTSTSSSQSQKQPKLGYYSTSPGMNLKYQQQPTQNNIPQNYFHYQNAMQNQARSFGYPGTTPWPQQGYNNHRFPSGFMTQSHQNQNMGNNPKEKANTLSYYTEEISNSDKNSRKRKIRKDISESTSLSDSTQPSPP